MRFDCQQWSTRTAPLFTLLMLLALTGDLTAGDSTRPGTTEQIGKMDDAKKSELVQKRHRFDELSPDQRSHLRQLYAQLSQDPQHDRLMRVLQQYSDWLKTLPAGQRAQLLSIPSDQRITQIKKIMRSQEAQRFRMMVDGRLSRQDMRTILDWADQFIKDHEKEIYAQLPKQRERPKTTDPARRRRIMAFFVFRNTSLNLPRPSSDDLDRLSKLISRDAREFLTKLDDDDERARVLNTWIRAATSSRFRQPVSRQQLAKFATERLNAEQRDFLESLPRDRWLRELHNLYYQDLNRRSRDSHRPFPRGGRRRHSPSDDKRAESTKPSNDQKHANQ